MQIMDLGRPDQVAVWTRVGFAPDIRRGRVGQFGNRAGAPQFDAIVGRNRRSEVIVAIHVSADAWIGTLKDQGLQQRGHDNQERAAGATVGTAGGCCIIT